MKQEDVSRKIFHAYGTGGRGYEFSWGIAEEVVGLVYGDKASRIKSSI